MTHGFIISKGITGYGFLGLHIFGLLVFAFVVVAVIYLLVKASRKGTKDNNINKTETQTNVKDDEAMAILRVRYAKGEIDFEEYTKIKETL